jgi:hypothetical protein
LQHLVLQGLSLTPRTPAGHTTQQHSHNIIIIHVLLTLYNEGELAQNADSGREKKYVVNGPNSILKGLQEEEEWFGFGYCFTPTNTEAY